MACSTEERWFHPENTYMLPVILSERAASAIQSSEKER